MNTRKTILVVAMAALASSIALAAGPSRSFKARLLGANEVPPVADTTTKASSGFRFNSDFSTLSFTLQLRKGENITEIHLHCAPAGANGPIVVSLAGLAGPAAVPLLGLIQGGFDGTLNVAGTVADAAIVKYPAGSGSTPSRGCSSVLGPGRDIVNLSQLAEAMRNGEIYVNAHSTAHPAGVVRGQVGRGSASSSSGSGSGSGGSGNTGGGGTSGGSGY